MNSQTSTLLKLCAAFILTIAVQAFDGASVYAQGKSIIVFDASGSMWGQLDGKAKITVAKDTLRSLVRSWSGGEVGLMVYGHRSKGACDDIELVVPVGPINAAAMESAIDGISPKGKTPMTDAVKRAAEILKFNESPATVILISDGEETCDASPCEVAAELEKLGINFTAHVVGFDLQNAGAQAREQMKCLANKTGGKFVEAASAAQLLVAIKEVINEPTVAPEPTVSPTPSPTPTSPPVPTPTTEVKIKENIKARAVLMEGGAPLESDLSWKLRERSPRGDGKQVAGSYDGTFLEYAPPGEYSLVVSSGVVTMQKDVTLSEHLLEVTLVLNAGYLTSKLVITEDEKSEAEPIKSDVTWTITTPGGGKTVTTSYDANPRWLVPAGEYELQAKWGSAKSRTSVSVTPGETTENTLKLSAGILALKTFAVEGGEQITSGLHYSVYENNVSIAGDRTLVTGGYDATPEYKLPAQKYSVVVKWGKATSEPLEIEVPSNERVERSLIVNAGVIAASFTSTKSHERQSWEVFDSKKRLDGTRKTFTSSYSDSEDFILPAGSYKVQLKLDDRTIEQEVTLKAGERVELVLEDK